ncbi:MAG: GTPase Era [Kofleriaceae bacterium]|jgi:GTP-binding protein Era|nr:GTPase Era [Kofleriaceae bacterium]MBP9170546.1 GTPase Era [Kofleriaceae bacterium]MBP9860982.1 GTPase Era [Kofleriaceae bacterium]
MAVPPTHLRAGSCAIVGLPNVGKSTLLNRLVGKRLVAVSPKPQTTRNRILGIHRGTCPGVEPSAVELCFVDTPGIQRGKGALRRFMREEALAAAADADVSLLMIDATERRAALPARLAEPDAGELLAAIAATPLVIALNKVDRAHKPELLPQIEAWAAWGAARPDPVEVVPISATTGDGVDALVAAIASRLPVGPAMFPPDMVTDRAESFLAAELIREQLFHQLGQELPYSAAVVVERFEEHDRGDLAIGAFIAVERESQKAIVIGRGGQRIKELGVAAREALTELFGCAVHLSLLVKIAPAWTTAEAGLRRFGYRGEP